jgi:glycosyltransferase involved in cell wall biosynthesis
MKIGWISSELPYLPSKGGFRLVGANLIQQLSRRHQIDLISLLRDEDSQHLDWARQFCASVHGIPLESPGVRRRVANFASGFLWGHYLSNRASLNAVMRPSLEANRWQLLHIEGDFAAGLLPAQLRVANVLSAHDSVVLRAREMLKCKLDLRERLKYRLSTFYDPRYERMVYPRFDRCVLVAERDCAFAKKLIPKARFVVISNGIDLDYFRPLPVQKDNDVVVFHGHLSYPPNVTAALEFADEIFPLIRTVAPRTKFHLVGAAPGPVIRSLAVRPGIELFPDLPDIRATLSSARVYVCALRFGTGIKNKILEAMGMKLPIVSYPGAVEGIECVPGRDLFIAQTREEFATQVVELLRHREKADQIAESGRQLVEKKYGWDAKASAYEELYRHIIEERRVNTSHK